MNKRLFFLGEEFRFDYQFRDFNGLLVTPLSGTVEIFDTDGAVVLAETAISISGNDAYYLYTADTLGEFVAYFKVQLPTSKPFHRTAFRVIEPDGVSQ